MKAVVDFWHAARNMATSMTLATPELAARYYRAGPAVQRRQGAEEQGVPVLGPQSRSVNLNVLEHLTLISSAGACGPAVLRQAHG